MHAYAVDIADVSHKNPTMPTSAATQEERLIELARGSPWFMSALTAVRDLDLPSWCIGAGAVRNLVWDTLHEYENPSSLADIDVVYFDASDLSPEREAKIERLLASRCPDLPWEVTNQAAVHIWFKRRFDHDVPPLSSLKDAVASWPEYATAVGLTLQPDNSIRIIAPYGLHDLFSLVVRRNPARVSIDTYRQRIEQKRYRERWPRVTIALE